MVVVVILAILATLVVPRVMGRPDEARMVKAKQDIQAIESALNLYKLDNFVYPSTDQGLESLVKNPGVPNWKEGGYLARVPKDPWGRTYLYMSPGANGVIDIYTLGANGTPGGTGADTDLGNWNLE